MVFVCPKLYIPHGALYLDFAWNGRQKQTDATIYVQIIGLFIHLHDLYIAHKWQPYSESAIY